MSLNNIESSVKATFSLCHKAKNKKRSCGREGEVLNKK
jgi:hypothetical protein